MGTDAVEAVKSVDPWMIILIIFGLFYLFKEMVEASKYILNTLGLERREDREKEETKDSVAEIAAELTKINTNIDNLQNNINTRMDKMQKDIDNVTEATREELGDKINTKYKHYFSLGYIPADEYDEFVNLHNAYKSVYGNHSGDAKFKRCERLKIIDDSTEEMRIEFNPEEKMDK